MLTARRVKLLSVALLMSGGTVVLTQQWLHGAVQRAAAQARSTAVVAAAPVSDRQVLVAAAALPAGTILKPGQVRWQPWPANAPTGDFLTQANVRLEQMNGAVVRTNVEPGEPLSAARLVQPGERGFMAAVLKPGYRAVTVNVTAATGVGGFVMPGDHVDLILSRSLDATGAKHDFVSETVLQDVRVLAMDQRGADAKKDVVVPQTATLEVTPKGAEIVSVSSQLGPLALSLRSLADPAAPVSQARVVTHTSDAEATGAPPVRAVSKRPAAKPKAAAAPAPFGIVVVRGAGAPETVPVPVMRVETTLARPSAYPGA